MSQLRDALARHVRVALGDRNNDELPITTIVSELVAELAALKAGDVVCVPKGLNPIKERLRALCSTDSPTEKRYVSEQILLLVSELLSASQGRQGE